MNVLLSVCIWYSVWLTLGLQDCCTIRFSCGHVVYAPRGMVTRVTRSLIFDSLPPGGGGGGTAIYVPAAHPHPEIPKVPPPPGLIANLRKMLLHGKRRHATLFLSIFKKPKELGRRKHLALFFMSELRITLENFEKIRQVKHPSLNCLFLSDFRI